MAAETGPNATTSNSNGYNEKTEKNKTVGKKVRTKAEKNATKRIDYLQWEEYFMMAALVASKRSKDPHTQVGVVLVDKNNKIVGTGYNGFPVGCSDDDFPWGKGNDDPLQDKYAYVGATLYTTTFPCNECAKLIIQSRIGSIIYLNDRPEFNFIAARKMFDTVGIPYKQFTMDKEEITVSLKRPE